jgi:hypothetical protein
MRVSALRISCCMVSFFWGGDGWGSCMLSCASRLRHGDVVAEEVAQAWAMG